MDLLPILFDPRLIFQAMGMPIDPWQEEYLFAEEREIGLNCARQRGKSTATAVKALHHMLSGPNRLVLVVSPGQRQSKELLRKLKKAWGDIGYPMKKPPMSGGETALELELTNGSRVVCLPGKESTIRCFSGVTLLIIDEAAKVPDDVYATVRPMLSTSKGQCILLSTPFGQRGFFWREMTQKNNLRKWVITWESPYGVGGPRITGEFVEEERRKHGDGWADQEFCCLFTALEGLVYPTFAKAVVDCYPMLESRTAKPLGGIDWGWRNPFCALWGLHDKDDCIWVIGERYKRQTPLYEHISAMSQPANPLWPRGEKVTWYGDPAGPTEITECRAAGLKVFKAPNEIATGVMAVTARINTGRLKILRPNCHNLIEESELYRYPNEKERTILGENPVDEYNHALGALRYMVAGVDRRYIARLRKQLAREGPDTEPQPGERPATTDEQKRESMRSVYQADVWEDDPEVWNQL